MLERYSRAEMREIWSEKNKFDTWLKIELLVCKAWSKLNVIPEKDVETLYQNASYKIERIYEIEKETKHDVIAFTRAVSERLGPEKKWIHYGLTSTDVVDTAYGYLYKQANTIIRAGLEEFIETLKRQALKYQNTICMGRTHGVHAEITTFGLKFALWYEEMLRNKERFLKACQDVECGKISGAVGTFANTPPEVQDFVCEELEIDSAKISTQVLQRDRHANYYGVLALIGASIEKMATEIRHLQRTEVREVEEYFNSGQKGSSAMPHKRNPIGSENMVGCARVLRGYMLSAFEDVSLWHERDISHSSVERIIAPDATELLDYMLQRFNNILTNLTVFPEKMLENVYATYGVIFSQRIMLSLIEKGVSREKAYDTVQPLAINSWSSKQDFKKLLLESKEIRLVLSPADIEKALDPNYHLKNVEIIYKRVGLL